MCRNIDDLLLVGSGHSEPGYKPARKAKDVVKKACKITWQNIEIETTKVETVLIIQFLSFILIIKSFLSNWGDFSVTQINILPHITNMLNAYDRCETKDDKGVRFPMVIESSGHIITEEICQDCHLLVLLA